MGIFSVIGLIIIISVCAILGMACLKLTKIPIGLGTVTVLTLTGGVVGFSTMVIWSFVFSNNNGQLDTAWKVVGMFLLAGVLAVISGLYMSSKYLKITNSRSK